MYINFFRCLPPPSSGFRDDRPSAFPLQWSTSKSKFQYHHSSAAQREERRADYRSDKYSQSAHIKIHTRLGGWLDERRKRRKEPLAANWAGRGCCQCAIGFMVFEVAAAAALNPKMFALESAPEAAITSENDSLQSTKSTKWGNSKLLISISTRASG